MKRNSQASGHGQSPTRETPVGGFAQPDERDQTAESRPVIDRKVLGPRRVIQQAARDIARGLVDNDQHGTPTDGCGQRSPADLVLPHFELLRAARLRRARAGAGSHAAGSTYASSARSGWRMDASRVRRSSTSAPQAAPRSRALASIAEHWVGYEGYEAWADGRYPFMDPLLPIPCGT